MGDNTVRMPTLFVGHGTPMNAIENNQFTVVWKSLARDLPKPKSILCFSAHYAGDESLVVTADKPQTIHDFYGFPEELNRKQYPAPGSPSLAHRVMDLFPDARPTKDWGIDHGAWSVLCQMYPGADIPVVQISLHLALPGAEMMAIGRRLRPLRDEGVLILGSGNVAHNLRRMSFGQSEPFPWARAFDEKVRELVKNRQYDLIADYMTLPGARESVPTNEHFVPLLYVLGASDEHDTPVPFCAEYVFGSLSMTGYIFS